MPLSLVDHLRALSEAPFQPLDLPHRLEQVRLSSEAIWVQQRLLWFTDHRSSTHSSNIIALLGQLLDHLQTTENKLTVHEVYILLAACYLHDIGMQDFQSPDGRGVDSFTDNDYLRIRADHPRRARELILQRSISRERGQFSIALADDAYLVPIALVSQAHGSAFFEGTVNELQVLPHRPANVPLRGGLLAALLLMGDELDLHEARATFPPEFSLSAHSLMHHLAHHYVTSVDLTQGRTSKHRQICLGMEFPPDSQEYRSDVISHLTSKLRRQCARTSPLIEACTSGDIVWEREIHIAVSTDRYGTRRSLLASDPARKAWHLMREEVLKPQLAPRESILQALDHHISAPSFSAVRILDSPESDWPLVSKWLYELCAIRTFPLVHVAFHEPIARGSLDVLRLFTQQLASLGIACPTYAAAPSDAPAEGEDVLTGMTQALSEDLLTMHGAGKVVILLERVDLAEPDTQAWLRSLALPKFLELGLPLTVIATEDLHSAILAPLPGISSYPLSPYTREDVSEILREEFGYSIEGARAEADRVLAFTEGSPLLVQSGLESMRRAGIRVTTPEP